LRAAAPEGLVIGAAERLGATDPAGSRVLGRADWAAWLPALPETPRTGGLTGERPAKRGTQGDDVRRPPRGRVRGGAGAGARGAGRGAPRSPGRPAARFSRSGCASIRRAAPSRRR